MVKKDGFYFLNGLDKDYLVVESDRLDNCLQYINNNKINHIYICNLYYFYDNLDFLKECNFIEYINVNSDYVINYDGLFYLSNLKKLIIQVVKTAIDLESLKSLNELAVDLKNKNVKGIDKIANLKKLGIWHYNPKSLDLSELSVISSLEELKIVRSNINSFNGCEKLHNLKVLDCAYMSKLKNIENLGCLEKTLQTLEFESCKKIINHESVISLNNLDTLKFVNCGEIDTIKFIDKMPNLKSFIFLGTTVIDGDMSPCARLEYVAFSNKKHYSHKVENFRSI